MNIHKGFNDNYGCANNCNSKNYPYGPEKEHVDIISKPSHYNITPDPIEIAMLYKLDFPTGNALKYILRAGRKDSETEISELAKAIECLMRKVESLKPKNNCDTCAHAFSSCTSAPGGNGDCPAYEVKG